MNQLSATGITVFVADTRQAKVFELSEPGADAPGTVMTRSGQNGSGAGVRRTALQGRRSHKQHGGGVVLVAAPRFLSELRSLLPKSTLQRVVRELPRDLVGLSVPALQQRLAAALRP